MRSSALHPKHPQPSHNPPPTPHPPTPPPFKKWERLMERSSVKKKSTNRKKKLMYEQNGHTHSQPVRYMIHSIYCRLYIV